MAKKANETFRITGRVIDRTTQQGIAGLRVEAWDKDKICDDLVGSAVTDEQGAFQIEFTSSHFAELFLDRQPDLFFKVFREDELIKSTEDSVLWNVAAENTEVVIEADVPSAVKPKETFVVRGQVRLADGSPCIGALVRAFDKDLRSREPLGKPEPVISDTEGRYEISYTADQFSRVEKQSADLLVEARQNEKTDWIAEPIRFNAQPIEIVNITFGGAYRGPSEFTLLVDEITPLLDGLTMSQLTENSEVQDITFLSNETGIDRQVIAWIAVSALRAEEEDLLRHEEYYGLFRQNLPTDLNALLGQDGDTLRGAIAKSARDNIIRPMPEQDLDDFVARVLQLEARRTLHPSRENEPASLGDLLTVAVDAGKHELIAKLFLERGGANDAFWKALEEETSVNPDELKAVRQTLALGAFTANHLPLVRALYQMGRDKQVFADLRGFAQLDETDWQAVLQRPQEPGDKNSKPIGFPPGQQSIEPYAHTLNQFIENTFPMAVIANQIQRDNSTESPSKEANSDVLVFISNNPEFSFTDTRPESYLSTNTIVKLRDIKNPDVLRAQLKSMQRVFNIVPSYPKMRALLADGLHSATAIVQLGKRRFTEKYAEPLGGTSKAREVYRKAEHVHATALNVYMKHAAAFNSPTPYVISGAVKERHDAGSFVAARSSLPIAADLSTLFGSLDLCDCEHCLSLYSPAAYFVDILKFLAGGPKKNDVGPSPLQVLLDQRPDIEHIELTCDNTNIELPYVDLVIEILEGGIAPRTFTILMASDDRVTVGTEFRAGRIPEILRLAFSNEGYYLSDNVSIREDGSSNLVLLDPGWVFVLEFQGLMEGIGVSAWPQTSWTSDELRANSEHTNDPAYAVLRGAVYPWNLPLDLPLEEVRAYLGHLGVQRHEVMETLFSGAVPDDVVFDKIALEYLGLAKEEADIITGVTTGGPVGTPSPAGAWNFWGLKNTDNDIVDRTDGTAPHAQGQWDVVLQRVSIFLQQSGLSYKELLELLGTYFINPPASAGTPGGRLLGIVSANDAPVDTCNLSQLEIQIVDNAIADEKEKLKTVWNRIHRFVRLCRKLGWTMRDLDKAITAQPKNNNGEVDINDPFLIKLSHIQRLHVETKLPVVNLLGWWVDIDTSSYVDHLADGEPTVASLYAQLFSNKTVSGQVVGEIPIAPGGTLSGKAAAIAAALQISVEDFTLLHVDENVIPRIPDPDDLTKTIQDDHLTLVNLSLLYRHATLATALKLPIRSHLITLELVNRAPFATTANTIQFIKHVDKIRASGFKIEDLDYLLRNNVSATSDIAVTDDLIAIVLDAIRDDLRKVSAENTFVDAAVNDSATTSDPNGDLTRKKLALLNWDPALIEKAIAVLNDTFTYETILTTSASSIVFPESLKSRISYDSTEQKLRFTGTMTVDDRTLLVASPNANPSFITAVGELFAGPANFVKRHMARFSVPVFSVSIVSALIFPVPVSATDLELFITMLAKLKYPDALKNKIFYDTVVKELRFVGIMTEAERKLLLRLPSDTNFRTDIQALFDAPIQALFNAPVANAPLGADIFLTSADAGTLFDNPDDKPQVRFLLVLKQLLPHLRTMLSEIVVKQRLGEYLKLDATAIDGLLMKWVRPQVVDPLYPARMAIGDYLDKVFAESSPNINSSKNAFPRQFDALLLLYKIAFIILKFKITPRQLQWLFEPKLNAGWLDLNTLPLGATAPTTSLFQGWERLADLFQLRDSLPRGEVVLADIFTSATAPGTQLNEVLEILGKGTQWEPGSLKSLSGSNGFNFSLSDFAGSANALAEESAILRLSGAFAMLKRLGASADQCLSWAKVPSTGDDARELKSLVRAKYDDAQWLELAKTLRDPLRERQRSALVVYLAQKLGVRGVDDLYDHFLIDVEMSPCMMTTRIKQAISSVQLFIQRCLMNLEQDVSLTPIEAQEWSQWRKWYRVWEANRKVLFYPENWIEPELRDDKSPFYKDLENELLQSDMTMDTAEKAFLQYLEKLDQVARLEIVGMYRQQEPGDIDQLKPIDIMHVFGRTYAIPHHYFYRRLKDGVWSAWEKVDLDIEGDHLIPVMWNRRMHLFWPIFTEKADQPTKTERANNDDPTKYWEIKFAWSDYKNNSWSPKKVSKEWLRYDKDPFSVDPSVVPQEPQDFSFKSRLCPGSTGDQLGIECYGTTLLPPTAERAAEIAKAAQEARAAAEREAEVEKARAEARTTNTEKVAQFSPAGSRHPIALDFTINGSELWKDQGKKITVEIRNGTETLETLSLNDANQARSAHEVDRTLDCYLISKDFAIGYVDSSSPGGGLVTDSFRHVDLKPWRPSPIGVDDLSESTRRPPGFPSEIHRMHRIAEFTLNDCNGDLVAVPIAEVVQSMAPTELIPYPNTAIQSMQFVEASGEHPLLTYPTVFGWNPITNSLEPISLLNTTPGTFRLLAPHQDVQFTSESPFFFQDGQRTYYVLLKEFKSFAIHFHPRVCEFIKALNRNGIPGLLKLENQRLDDSGATFWANYLSAPLYQLFLNTIPKEDVDFEYGGAYSLYNWELFFHTPFLIAMRLSKNQRFEEAQKWFHYIFDPTATDSPDKPGDPGPERFWRVKPFYDEAMRPTQTLDALIADAKKLEDQVKEWETNPFKPHVIARMRVVAYMKAVVMRYIDNLVAWGDQLFRRDTLESINEATQLYILAGQILGRRPESIPARAKAKTQTFRTLDDVKTLDSLSNAVVEIESFLAPSVAPASTTGYQGAPLLTMQYFCITGNDKLLGYWDKVSDRLFKIRHCMNIEGVGRSLPIFEPPIDPALLVRAAAAGIDIASALNDINSALPHYRFNIMLQKATELCNDVKALGAAFLSALEKQDAEQLALLRSSHEVELLKAIRGIKEQQTNEANNSLQGLIKYQEVVIARQQYYLSRPNMNSYEEGHLAQAAESKNFMFAQAGAETIAAIMHLIPDTKGGAITTIGATYGGANIASAVQAFGGAAGTTASILNTSASLSATLGGYQRRQEDWTHQADLATKELKQVEKQIVAAEIRLAISEHELQNHDLQIENAKEVDAYMRAQKFTNQELYSWMVGQLSGIYFQSYQLAYDVAKRAERAYRYELGLNDSNFIQFGYWDSLKKGLLSGERLYHDLKRMDAAYLDQNKREYEITKHISLITIDPISLVKLKQTGECFVSLPEALFDIDYPGHYMRRIKSVSITIPCVTGPYAGINCTLTHLNSSVRHANALSSGEYLRSGDDTRFSDTFGTIQSIVTSSGQSDSGLFETSMRDERYLPFEGQGAISTWRIQLPTKFESFDYATISDVILHIRYTARDGGEVLRAKCTDKLAEVLSAIERASNETGLVRLFSLRQEFPTEWHRLISGTNPNVAGDLQQSFVITKNRFPFLFGQREIKISAVDLYAVPKSDAASPEFPALLTIELPKGIASTMEVGVNIRQLLAKILTPQNTLAVEAEEGKAKWKFKVPHDGVADFQKDIDDILMVCHYSI